MLAILLYRTTHPLSVQAQCASGLKQNSGVGLRIPASIPLVQDGHGDTAQFDWGAASRTHWDVQKEEEKGEESYSTPTLPLEASGLPPLQHVALASFALCASCSASHIGSPPE